MNYNKHLNLCSDYSSFYFRLLYIYYIQIVSCVYKIDSNGTERELNWMRLKVSMTFILKNILK